MSKLKYYNPAKNWEEALPIGNGFLGGMIYGDTIKERIQINEDSVWTSGIENRISNDSLKNINEIRNLLFNDYLKEAELLAKQSMFAKYPHMSHYQTLGDIWIEYFNREGEYKSFFDEMGLKRIEKSPKPNSKYQRTLNLKNALGEIKYTYNNRDYSNEYFASNPGNFIAYKIESENNDLALAISLTRKDGRSGRGASYIDGYEVEDNNLSIFGKTNGSRGIEFYLKVKVVNEGGRQYKRGGNLIVEGAKKVILYITARTSYRSNNLKEYCDSVLNKLSIEKYNLIKSKHIEDYQSHFNKSSLTLDQRFDEELSTKKLLEMHRNNQIVPELIQTYFDYGHYLLISSSREGSLPANLQGIWNQDFQPPWGSKYTININIEMNYWFAEKSGLGQLQIPLISHLKKMLKNGREVAEKMYGCRGFCCHHNTDIWGDCAPQDQSIGATIWPMGGAWLSLHLLEHFVYSKDKKFLDEYFDIYQESVLFFTDYMVKNRDGKWVTGPSVSPENLYINSDGTVGSMSMGPTMDIEIVKELFNGYLQLVKYKQNEMTFDIVPKVHEILNDLPELQIGSKGQIQEWANDYDEFEEGHRHISQLFSLYPGNSIDFYGTPELAEAAEVTLNRRLYHGGGHTGWSKAWIINLWAQLNNGEEAFKHFNELISESTQDNLLDSHPPFQIDGNFGAVNGIYEMLIRDKGNVVYLLPAIAKDFPNGTLTGYILRNGGEINLSWENGIVKSFEINNQLEDLEIVFNRQRKKITVKENN